MSEITMQTVDGTTYYFFQGVAHEYLTNAICAALEEGITPEFKF